MSKKNGSEWAQGPALVRQSQTVVKTPVEGRPLNELYEHPFMNDRIRILKVYSPETGSSFVSCNEAMLNFNADSGRLWAA